MGLIDSIVSAESGGNPNAKNPNSSASGPGQFIDSTWLSTLKAHRPDLAEGKSDSDLLALKNDPALSRELTGAYATDNQAILSKAGVPVTAGTTYLAHFAGPQGAVKVLQADPNAPVGDILGPAVVRANPFLKDMTAQGLQAWAAKKMGITAPQPGVQTQSPAGPVNAVPQQVKTLQPALPAIPPPAAATPIFAQQPQAAPQAPQSVPLASAISEMPMPQMAQALPIFIPPRKPINLSALRTTLAARVPIFANRG